MLRYIKILFVLLLIFFSYCTFIWYQPKVAENIDYMFNSSINKQLLENIKIFESSIYSFWSGMKNWIDNPAPNNSSNINERKTNAQEAN